MSNITEVTLYYRQSHLVIDHMLIDHDTNECLDHKGNKISHLDAVWYLREMQKKYDKMHMQYCATPNPDKEVVLTGYDKACTAMDVMI